MSRQVIWTKLILETFIREGNLTKEEEMIIRTRCAGWTRTRQANEFNMSIATVDKIINRLKIKYDLVQKTEPLLPPRQKTAKELYKEKDKSLT